MHRREQKKMFEMFTLNKPSYYEMKVVKIEWISIKITNTCGKWDLTDLRASKLFQTVHTKPSRTLYFRTWIFRTRHFCQPEFDFPIICIPLLCLPPYLIFPYSILPCSVFPYEGVLAPGSEFTKLCDLDFCNFHMKLRAS